MDFNKLYYHLNFILLRIQIIIKSFNSMSIQNFTILEQLGQGSFAKVFKVIRKTDNKIYALKQINIDKLDQKSKQNALNQVRFLASFNCKNIIKYYEAFFQESLNFLCIVMQYANDGDLSKLISQKKEKKERIFQVQIWKILISLIHGLQYLHSRSILHRDIKPQNIFIVNGQYKIGDLNVSKLSDKSRAKLTQIGTPFYASPQIWQNNPYDNKCDIWSLGCVIYQVATLNVPFSGKSMDKLYEQIMHSKIKPIPKVYSDELGNIINRCLQKNMQNRTNVKQLHQNFTVKMYENLYYTSVQLQLEEEKSKYMNLLKTINFKKYIKIKDIQLPQPHYDTSTNPHQSKQNMQEKYEQQQKKKEKQIFDCQKVKKEKEQDEINNIILRPLIKNYWEQQQEEKLLKGSQQKRSMIQMLLLNKKTHKQKNRIQQNHSERVKKQKMSIKQPQFKINSSFDRLMNKKNRHKSQISIPKFVAKIQAMKNKHITIQNDNKRQKKQDDIGTKIQIIYTPEKHSQNQPEKQIDCNQYIKVIAQNNSHSKRCLHRTQLSAKKLYLVESNRNSKMNSKVASVNNSDKKQEKIIPHLNKNRESDYLVHNFSEQKQEKDRKLNEKNNYIYQCFDYKNMIIGKLPKNNRVPQLYHNNYKNLHEKEKKGLCEKQNNKITQKKTKKRIIQEVQSQLKIQTEDFICLENNQKKRDNKMQGQFEQKTEKTRESEKQIRKVRGKIFNSRQDSIQKIKSIQSNILT